MSDLVLETEQVVQPLGRAKSVTSATVVNDDDGAVTFGVKAEVEGSLESGGSIKA